MLRLGVVSFLNARPLIEGLEHLPEVQCVFDVPAALPGRLNRGEVDVALIPTIDVARGSEDGGGSGGGPLPGGHYRVVSDACIGSDGETMTVRVFSQVPPDRMTTLWVDPDSHTSVALARIVWMELYGRELALRPLARERDRTEEFESVLLIGDKVVDPRRGRYAFEVDLGGAWRQLTGLPFVFAVWACRDDRLETGSTGGLAAFLSAARDRGVARAAEIAATCGPTLGWPVELARRYLTRCLKFTLDERAVAGANRFARQCVELGLAPADAEIAWPERRLETTHV